MRKQLLLIALVWLFANVCQAQKKYEMVIEKTDGTNIVVNTEDILRTYFRERTGGDTPQPAVLDIVGTWNVYEGDQEGLDGIWTFKADGTGTIEEFYHGESEGVDKMKYNLSGTRLTVYFEGEEDDPMVFDINVASENEFTWTDGHDTLTFKRQGSGDDQPQSFLSCPDDHHPHLIDLGLPSGTKWQCCNEGASKPEDFGGYYKFGEVSSAPSLDQIKELLNNCRYSWTTLNGVKGGRFTGKNGGTIFLPAAGGVWDGELGNVGSGGYYWSSTPYDGCYAAYDLYFDSSIAGWYHWGVGRDEGDSVRPVR